MSCPVHYKFRLYVAADALNSAQAQANLMALCRSYVPERYEVELVDVFKEPQRALTDGIFLTPTLVRLAPLPVRRIVGTLSQTALVVRAMNLDGGIE